MMVVFKSFLSSYVKCQSEDKWLTNGWNTFWIGTQSSWTTFEIDIKNICAFRNYGNFSEGVSQSQKVKKVKSKSGSQ